jgi:hypothetical protein
MVWLELVLVLIWVDVIGCNEICENINFELIIKYILYIVPFL